MNSRIQNKINQYKKLASSHHGSVGSAHSAVRADSLTKVIRTQKDADEFMAEIESVVKRAK